MKYKIFEKIEIVQFYQMIPGVPGGDCHAPQGPQGSWGQFLGPPGPCGVSRPRQKQRNWCGFRLIFSRQNLLARTRRSSWFKSVRFCLWPMPPPGDFSKFSKKSHFSKNWSKSVFKPCLGRFGLQIRIQREKPVLFMGSNHYFIIF